MKDDVSKLKALGRSQVKYPADLPRVAILETFPNKFSAAYEVIHKTDEFTSLCPVTGQPDYGTITICYSPWNKCVESKSLKLYLASYRNEGCFMETLVNSIFQDLQTVIEPNWIRIEGTFKSRGGIETTIRRISVKTEDKE